MKIVESIAATIRTEPVRSILYPVLILIVGTLVAKGIISDFSADTVVALIAAALGIPAAEAARRQVWPDVKVRATVRQLSEQYRKTE